MKRRVLCLLMVFALLTGMSIFAADDTDYLFQTAGPITDEELLSQVQVISESWNLYETRCTAVLLELDAAGQLVMWEENGEISLIGLEAEEEALASAAWTNAMLGQSYAKRNGITGEGIRIGMIDSGLRSDFAELTGITVIEGVNLLAAENTEERHNTVDNYGHGTAVANVIGSVAPGAELVPLKCFESTTTNFNLVIEAIDIAVNVYHCNVLNLSLGIKQDKALLYIAVREAFDAGAVLVAACGNLTSGTTSTGNDIEFYPAAYPEVISVGAVDREKKVTALSVQNDTVAVVAPGDKLGTLSKSGSGLTSWSGTSLASPFAAGAAALAMSVDPTLKPLRLFDLMTETAEDLGNSGFDNAYGYGLLNIGLLLADIRKDTEDVVVTGAGENYSLSAYVPKTKDGYQVMLAQYDADGRFLSVDTVQTGKTSVIRNLPLSDVTNSYTIFILDQGTWRPLHSEARK